jgi:hypothetical protein
MKYTSLFILALALLSCKAQKSVAEEVSKVTIEEQVAEETNENIEGKPQRPYQVTATVGDVSQKTDAYTIENAKIQGNKLFLDISYTGGCAWHKFEFVGSMAVMKSMPPQRAVKLIHDADNDSCESIVKQTIEIDISALADAQIPGREIVLILDGYNERLNYIYE